MVGIIFFVIILAVLIYWGLYGGNPEIPLANENEPVQSEVTAVEPEQTIKTGAEVLAEENKGN